MRQCFLILIFFSELCFAWGKQGHLIIAEIAYNNLNPPAKYQVNKLINYLNKVDGPTDFIKASIWADEIKFKNNKLFNKWHYINSPIVKNIRKRKKTYPPNILTKSKELISILKNKNTSIYNQAWSLRMLIHLIGDLHQPLHTATLYNKKFKRGDLGGLKYKINSPYKNLHSYWDQGGGLLRFKYNKTKQRQAIIKHIIKDNSMSQTLLNNNFEASLYSWYQNSHLLAEKIVYQQPQRQRVSFKYKKLVQSTSKQQLAKSGYHLAQLLNIIYR